VGGVVVVDLVDGVKPGVDDEITGTINQLLDQGHRQFVLNLDASRSSIVLGSATLSAPTQP